MSAAVPPWPKPIHGPNIGSSPRRSRSSNARIAWRCTRKPLVFASGRSVRTRSSMASAVCRTARADPQAEDHAADLALVLQIGAEDLQHDGEAQHGGGVGRFRRARRAPAGHRREPVGGQHREGLHVVEREAAVGAHPVEDAAHPGAVGFEVEHVARRQLGGGGAVAPVLREVQRAAHGAFGRGEDREAGARHRARVAAPPSAVRSRRSGRERSAHAARRRRRSSPRPPPRRLRGASARASPPPRPPPAPRRGRPRLPPGACRRWRRARAGSSPGRRREDGLAGTRAPPGSARPAGRRRRSPRRRRCGRVRCRCRGGRCGRRGGDSPERTRTRASVSAAASRSSSPDTRSTPARRSAASITASPRPEPSASRPPARSATTGRVRATARAAEMKARRFRMRRMSRSTTPASASRAIQSSAVAKPTLALPPTPITWLKPRPSAGRPVEHGARGRCGLAHQRELAARRLQMRERCVQPQARHAQSEAVRPQHAHAGAGRDLHQARRRAGHDGGPAPALRERGHGAGEGRSGQAEHGEVRRRGQIGDRGHAFHARGREPRCVHRSGEAAVHEVAGDHLGIHAPGLGEQGDAAGPEQRRVATGRKLGRLAVRTHAAAQHGAILRSPASGGSARVRHSAMTVA